MKQAPGLLLTIAGIIIFMGIIVSETYYPEYSTKEYEISDLGASKEGVIKQPSSTIFNLTMIFSGILTIIAMAYLFKKWQHAIFILFGIGILGVGIFPGNIIPFHQIFAMMTFTAGGISAILSQSLVKGPLRYLFISLGSISLLFLFLSELFIPFLGMGGTERVVAYTIVFWMISFGSYIYSDKNNFVSNY